MQNKSKRNVLLRLSRNPVGTAVCFSGSGKERKTALGNSLACFGGAAVLPPEGTPADDSDTEPEDTSEQQEDRQKVCQPVRDVLQEELADLKPVEIDAQSTAVDVAPRGHSAVPAAKGENTYRLPPMSLLRPGEAPG